MDLIATVLAGFLAAALAPTATTLLRRAAGPVLSVVPLSLFVYLCGELGDLPSEGRVVSYAWAPDFYLQFSFRLDGLSLLFALLITGMGAVVLLYSSGYLAGDPRLGRLYSLLLAFMASMLGVVLSDNFFAIFIFWELTSITSYLLIGFDHERPAARAAALQALMVTSGGGLALLAGFVLLGQAGVEAGLPAVESHSVSAWFAAGTSAGESRLYVPALVLILIGAFTKSAQYPFHFWLPGAMEAPTPVSAYLHSATMVKAGVYLLARLTPILAGTEVWHWSLLAVGMITMLVGAVMAISPRDLKQILAYSTVSALGLLVMLIGDGSQTAIAAAVTFTAAHALYKGALFLVAGAVDHGAGTRDVGELSGLRRAMPITAGIAAIAGLSMAAVPPLFGFIAKEQFYEAALHGRAPVLATTCAMAASALFVAISLIVSLGPFWRGANQVAAHVHEVGASMWLGPAVLAVGSIVLGIVPFAVDQPVMAPAVRAVLNDAQPTELHLALWHGLNVPLLLSMITFAVGIGVYAMRKSLAFSVASLSARGPADAYEWSLDMFLKVSGWQTHILQSGYLRYYLLTIVGLIIVLTSSTLFIHDEMLPLTWDLDVKAYEAAICLLIAIAAGATVWAAGRIPAIVALGVVGYSVALLFVLFGAPDLAMTQFLVETLTVVLFVFVLYRLPPQSFTSGFAGRVRDAVVAVTTGGLMATIVLLVAEVDPRRDISTFYVDNSVPEAHGRNIVNVILVDFRALDTLGEITVLALAAVGVYSLIKLRRAEEVR